MGNPPIQAKAGDTLTVSVTVDTGHLVPYSVKLGQQTMLDSLVSDESTSPPLTSGTHQLSWFFIHGLEDDWSHELKATVGGKAARTLDKRSKKAGDGPNGGDVVEVVVA